MTEFITRNYGNENYEIIIKTDRKDHYRETEDFARRLIDHAKHMTNADRIRAMSDEELAELLVDGCCGSKCDDQPQNEFGSVNCFQCRLTWLHQPAEKPKEE